MIGLERGFTLLELLVTIVIASIVLALAVPSFQSLTLNGQRTTAINEMLQAIQFARAQAVTLRVPVTICRSSSATSSTPACAAGAGWENGWIVFTDRGATVGTLQADDANADINGDGSVTALDAVLIAHEPLPASTTTLRGNGVAATGTVNRISFSAAGITTNAGSIVYCDRRGLSDANSKVLVVSTGGRVRSTSPGDASVTSCTP